MREILGKVAALPINTWNYKAQDKSIRHIGRTAQDLYLAFGVGQDDRHISSIDGIDLAPAGVKQLTQENQELRQIIEQLQRRISQLETAQSSHMLSGR